MSSIAAAQRTLGRVLPPLWLLLVTGIGWTLVALIVLRLDYTSVSAISILFGFVAVMAGVLELGVLVMAEGLWKLLHAASGGGDHRASPVRTARQLTVGQLLGAV
jgi:uncharacterized membrane protein HdeD (DUF308 family)